MSNNDISQIFLILEDKLSLLISMCEKQVEAGSVPIETRDLVEEILTKERRMMDKIVHKYFIENIFTQGILPQESKTEFPICTSSKMLDKSHKRHGIPSLLKVDPRLFSQLDDIQPYKPGYEWLTELQKYSNLGHNVLISVTKEHCLDGIHYGGVSIISPNMNLKNVVINNIQIRELITKDGKIIKADIDEELKNILNINYFFYVQGTKVDVLMLCKQGLALIKKMSEELL